VQAILDDVCTGLQLVLTLIEAPQAEERAARNIGTKRRNLIGKIILSPNGLSRWYSRWRLEGTDGGEVYTPLNAVFASFHNPLDLLSPSPDALC
jgi:hypothetical protein